MAQKHRLFVVSDAVHSQLQVHSMEDGSLVRTIGAKGSGKGQFAFSFGSLCTTPDGDSVLVCEAYNNRVQEVQIVGTEDTSRYIRFVGKDVLRHPEDMDCNKEVIVVTEALNRISVFSWRTGDLLSQFGSEGRGLGQLCGPRGIRLISGARLVVADICNRRLCIFGLDGEFVKAFWLCLVKSKMDYVLDDGFVAVTNHFFLSLRSSGEYEHVPFVSKLREAILLAPLSDRGLAVRGANTIRLYRGLELRAQWVAACIFAGRTSLPKM